MTAFIRLCLRRPVSVAAAYVLVLVLAGVAVVRVPVALLPDLGYPALAVWTAYPDVPPARVERGVTERIEEAVAGTDGLQQVTGRSQLGGSLVDLRFGWNADLDRALLDVREQLARLGDVLPETAERPVVLRLDPSERPIMMLALRGAVPDRPDPSASAGGASQDLTRLRQIGREVVARRLEQLDGVARVRVTGGYERRVNVTLDPDRMASQGLSVSAITQALDAANVALPGGRIRRGPFQYAVEVSGEFQDVDAIAETVVGRAGRALVRLRDVATVRMGVEERRGLVRLDGREALLLLVERRPDANTVEAAADVRAALQPLEGELPGVQLDVVVDESVFIEAAIGGVVQAVLLGGLLAIIVLFAFLRRRRVVTAIALTVPLSLALTLVLFDALSVTFNLIALSGLALGVGLLVDNAIVVTENIARLREERLTAMDAARAGAAEVAGAITASTLTTMAVFLPITFVEGLAGRLFRDQSLAVVCSLGASLLVALTLVPLVLSRDEGNSTSAFGWKGSRLLAWYERSLQWSLGRSGVVLGLSALLLMGASLVGWMLPREVVPAADQGRVAVHLTLPPGADLPLVSARARAVEERARQEGLARHLLADLGERSEARLDLDPRPPYEGDLTLVLPDTVSAQAATARLEAMAWPPDLAVKARPAQTQLEALLTTGSADLLIDLTAEVGRPDAALIDSLRATLQRQPALTDVRRAEETGVPAYELRFRRDALARFGVQPAEVGAYLEASARGRRATELREVSEAVPIVVRARNAPSIEALLARQIPTPTGRKPLRVFIDAEPVTLPAALLRVGQTPVTRLTAGVAPGADLAAATRAIDATLAEGLPPGTRGSIGGASTAFRDSLRAVGWSLLLSLVLVYLILTAQFERLLQPLVILAAVPLAAAGVALVLGAAGQSINLMSLTGCVVLVGIVVNDAIIKVDFINQRRAEGLDLRCAIIRAGRERVRPILMTTLTTTLGLLPLALGLGAGAELRAPLAIAIVGGLLSATLLTLFVVPVLVQLVGRVENA